MKRIETKIGDDSYEQILSTGQTIYSFVQNAILEKLERESRKKEVDEMRMAMNSIVQQFERQIEKATSEIAETAIAQIKVSRALLDENIEKDGEFKQKLSGVLQRIHDSVVKK